MTTETLDVVIHLTRDGLPAGVITARVRTHMSHTGTWGAVVVGGPSRVANGLGVTELGAVLALLADTADAGEITA